MKLHSTNTLLKVAKAFISSTPLGLVLLLFPFTTRACTCEFYGDNPRAWMRHAKVVFSGEVLQVVETPTLERREGFSQYAVRLRVERFWKGVGTTEFTVYTDLHGCGPDLQVGKKYLVYAMGKGLETACSGTKELTQATADLPILGLGKAPKR